MSTNRLGSRVSQLSATRYHESGNGLTCTVMKLSEKLYESIGLSSDETGVRGEGSFF